MAYQQNDKNPVERFWGNVKKTSSCWLWTGYKEKDGYGRFRVGRGKRMRAHRFSWLYLRGDIPENKIICHKCDNPICVNPDHLFVGTHKENTTDMFNKGRWVRPKNHFITCCINGHERNSDNIYKDKGGRNRCRPCIKLHNDRAKKRGNA